jgi:hypothetical protein
MKSNVVDEISVKSAESAKSAKFLRGLEGSTHNIADHEISDPECPKKLCRLGRLDRPNQSPRQSRIAERWRSAESAEFHQLGNGLGRLHLQGREPT